VKLKVGEPLEILTLDHTSDDSKEGWHEAKQFKSAPSKIAIRGYFVGQTKFYITLAMAKAGDSFGTLFHVIKNPGMKISRGK